jgi:hypothetical protein
MTYSKKKKATNHANCVSLITEERAREIVDKRDKEANALFNIINSLGSIYLTYFEGLKKLNDQFNFSRTNPALSKAFGFFGDMEKCVSYADRAMNDNLKYDGLCNPLNQLLFDSVTTFIEAVTGIDSDGKLKPLSGNNKDIIFLPTDLANALKASPVYAPYINSLGDRMQRALDEMLANEEKYNIKSNNDDKKSNI